MAGYLTLQFYFKGRRRNRDKNRYADGNCFPFPYANSKLLGLLIILLISGCIFKMVSEGSLNANSQKEICTDRIEQNFEEEKFRCKVLVLSWNNWNATLSAQIACTEYSTF